MNFKNNGTNSILPPDNAQNCPHRLPCGICSKTDRMCPINPGLIQPTWISSQPMWTTSNTSNTIGGNKNE